MINTYSSGATRILCFGQFGNHCISCLDEFIHGTIFHHPIGKPYDVLASGNRLVDFVYIVLCYGHFITDALNNPIALSAVPLAFALLIFSLTVKAEEMVAVAL